MKAPTEHGRAASRRRPAAARWLLPALVVALVAPLACARTETPGSGKEQVFRFRLREDPPTLDPQLAIDQLSESVLFGMFRGLVELDPGTLEVLPAVASSWSISDDRLTYTFRLRDDVFFHNGRRLTARDVRYSFERLLRPRTAAPRRFILEPIAGAKQFTAGRSPSIAGLKTPDDLTVEIRLAEPFAPFLGQLTLLAAAILPSEVYGDPERSYLRAPVGCGPFRFARWEQSNFLELRSFERFYGGRPALDRVVARIIENRQSALQEYVAGGLDSLDEVPDAHDEAMRERLKDEIHVYPTIGTGFIGFNLDLPPLRGNPALRKALNYAVDKRYLWEVLIPGPSVPARGIIPPAIPGYDPAIPGYPHDPDRAVALLAEAGYPGGKGLPPLSLWVNTSEDNRRIAQQIQSDLREVGVEVSIREVDWGAYLHAVEGTAEAPGQAQMFRLGWYLDYPDADAILRPLFHSANLGPAGNYFRYRNPEFDRLIARALAETDPGVRGELYRRAERIVVMEDAAVLLLNYYGSQTLFKPYVKGIVLSPMGEFRIPLERLRIDRRPA
ncbi:MAG: ABC transporter substrate-binding protein [Acidobacteriota bacterium]